MMPISTNVWRISRRVLRLTGVALIGAVLLAGSACGKALYIYDLTCTMSNVNVSGSRDSHVYAYALACNGESGFALSSNVRASYDVNTGTAQEKIEVSQGTVTAEWKCLRDPWTRGANEIFDCVQAWRKADLQIEDKKLLNTLTNQTYYRPYSAEALSDANRQLLDAKLQHLLKQQQPAQTRNPSLPVTVPASQQPAQTRNPNTSSMTTGGTNTLPKQPVGQTVDRSSKVYVDWVQAALNKVDNAQIPVDGDYGPVTASAVRTFQQRKGLFVDGVVGEVTEKALVAAGAPNPPGARRTGEARVK